MKTPRRKFSASFKAKVAIEAIKEQTSLPELAAKFEIHPAQISNWKREFLKNADLAFGSKSEKEDSDVDTAPLYSKIGQLLKFRTKTILRNGLIFKFIGVC